MSCLLARRFGFGAIRRIHQVSSLGLATMDRVNIFDLLLKATVGPDAWNQLSPQDVVVSLKMGTDFSRAAGSDDLNYSLNYAVISKKVTQYLQSKHNWNDIGALSRSLCSFALKEWQGIDDLKLIVSLPTANIRAKNISYTVQSTRNKGISPQFDILKVSDFKILTLIGVFNFERLQKQYVDVQIEIPRSPLDTTVIPYQDVIKKVAAYVETANFKTVEALVDSIGTIVANQIQNDCASKLPLTVQITKLNAITATKGVGVARTRLVEQFVQESTVALKNAIEPNKFDLPTDSRHVSIPSREHNIAYLAFGSNLGDRFENIQTALCLLAEHPKIKILHSSSLFESNPMYFTDQDQFINGCTKISTDLTPHELLKLCKEIEYEGLKRVKDFENGPRSLDLDIILYLNSTGNHVLVNDEELVIPHPRMLERSFVLEPLLELLDPEEVHPITAEPMQSHLNDLWKRENNEDLLLKLVPLPSISTTRNGRFLRFRNVLKTDMFSSDNVRVTDSPTYLMGIVNITPDSFSDDGMNSKLSIEEQLLKIKNMCLETLRLHKSVIIDIGGCSTRPNSAQVEEQEEVKRVIPLIKALRACHDIPQEDVIISVDTYRSNVALSAIEAGADIINDISAGTFDPNMFKVVAAHPNVGYVLSHIRGNISTMNKMTQYIDNASGTTEFLDNVKDFDDKSTALIRTIGRELGWYYLSAISNGVARWQIIIDPGIGFAKKGYQNLQIIKHLPYLKNYSCKFADGQYVNLRNLPVLVGPSRKKFIGDITMESKAKERDFTTGSLVTVCIGYGADIVRVHELKQCAKSVKLADALYKEL